MDFHPNRTPSGSQFDTSMRHDAFAPFGPPQRKPSVQRPVIYARLRWVRQLVSLTATEKLILLLLTIYVGPEGTCFPSQKTLALESGLCRRTVGNTLKSLELKGVIVRRHRGKAKGRTTDEILIRYFRKRS